MEPYKKSILNHPELYIPQFTKNKKMPYVLFIHGGPGLNCGIIEYLIENNELFKSMHFNIILYDQRNCGRSKKISANTSHQDNLNDLERLVSYVINVCGLKIGALIGHSYGAKLLYDFYKNFSSTIPGVFVSTANSILVPRLNNLMLDLAYLKKNNLIKYDNLFNQLKDLNLDKIWDISEQLGYLFQENEDRAYAYWANLGSLNMVKSIQGQIKLPLNTEAFNSVRKDLYSKESNFSVDIESLDIKKAWINGFHDVVMNGHQTMLSKNTKIIPFYKSAHYPHIEENDYFSEILNEFVSNP